MRDSIWSIPYYNEADFMERGATRLLEYISLDYKHLQETFLKIPGDDWGSKLEHCASCKCCARHQTFRPSRLEKWTDDMSGGHMVHTDSGCKCDCRHMARLICRNLDTTCPTIEN